MGSAAWLSYLASGRFARVRPAGGMSARTSAAGLIAFEAGRG
jgi:hypothetical protein